MRVDSRIGDRWYYGPKVEPEPDDEVPPDCPRCRSHTLLTEGYGSTYKDIVCLACGWRKTVRTAHAIERERDMHDIQIEDLRPKVGRPRKIGRMSNV